PPPPPGPVRPPCRALGGGQGHRLPRQRLLDVHDRRGRERQLPAPVLLTLDDLRAAVGTDLGTSPWVEVTTTALDQFDAATGGGPEYLALALTNRVLPDIVTVDASAGLNVGTDSVRFPGPLAGGGRGRGGG